LECLLADPTNFPNNVRKNVDAPVIGASRPPSSSSVLAVESAPGYYRSLRAAIQDRNHYFRSLRRKKRLAGDRMVRDHYFRSLRSSPAAAQDHYFRSMRADADHYFR